MLDLREKIESASLVRKSAKIYNNKKDFSQYNTISKADAIWFLENCPVKNVKEHNNGSVYFEVEFNNTITRISLV